jgi:hypothetical protein
MTVEPFESAGDVRGFVCGVAEDEIGGDDAERGYGDQNA